VPRVRGYCEGPIVPPLRAHEQASLRLGAFSPLLRGAETCRIETFRGLLRVLLGTAYAVTGRTARGSGLLRVPLTKGTGVVRKDAYCPLFEPAKRKTPKCFSRREKRRWVGRSASDIDDECLCRKTMHVVGRSLPRSLRALRRAPRGSHCGSASLPWPEAGLAPGFKTLYRHRARPTHYLPSAPPTRQTCISRGRPRSCCSSESSTASSPRTERRANSLSSFSSKVTIFSAQRRRVIYLRREKRRDGVQGSAKGQCAAQR
jgi:hypothetical protein